MRQRSPAPARSLALLLALAPLTPLRADIVIDNSPAATHGTAGSHTVTGSGTTLNVTPGTDADANGATDDLLIGLNSTGALTITDGAAVTVPGTGAVGFLGGTHLGVGAGSTGTLTVSAGGSLAALGLTVGDRPDATGTLLVTGTGSSVTLDSGGWGFWVASPTSTATITAGASLTSTADSVDNGLNAGSLTVSAGASLSTGYVNSSTYSTFYLDTTGIPFSYDSLGLTAPAAFSTTALVTGTGTTWNHTGSLVLVGNNADTVSLTIADHAALNLNGSLYVGTASAVTLSGGATAAFANITGLWADIYLNGGSLSLAGGATITGAKLLQVGGDSGTGTLTISGGSTLGATTLAIGTYGDGFTTPYGGSLLVTGAGSALAISGSGSGATEFAGTGTLTITDGGSLTTDRYIRFYSDATVSAGGHLASTYATGSLTNILQSHLTVTGSGSTLSLAKTLRIYDSGGNADLTIADHASFTSTADLTVGYNSSGTFNVTSGATVSTAGALIGYGTSVNTTYSNSATVTGAGSVWNKTGYLALGSRRNASLTVAAGGVLNNAGDVTLGALGAVTATALVTGSGSQLNVTGGGTLAVGSGSTTAPTGQLTIADHGLVSASSVQVNSGFANAGYLALGSFGQLATAALTVNSGGTVLAHDAAVFAFDLGAPSLTAPLAFGAGSSFTADTGATIYLLLHRASGFAAGTYALFSFDPTATLTGLTAPTFVVATDFAHYGYSVDLTSTALNLTVTDSPLTDSYAVAGLTNTVSAVPEPATTAAIFGLVILGGVVLHRRRSSP